jgi:hypothetical protein
MRSLLAMTSPSSLWLSSCAATFFSPMPICVALASRNAIAVESI